MILLGSVDIAYEFRIAEFGLRILIQPQITRIPQRRKRGGTSCFCESLRLLGGLCGFTGCFDNKEREERGKERKGIQEAAEEAGAGAGARRPRTIDDVGLMKMTNEK
jgi:hypothetical protein